MITETDQVAKALGDAARRWPQDRDSRTKLLLHLLEEGHHALLDQTGRRLAAIERTSGSFTGMYEADYLERLRDEWPE